MPFFGKDWRSPGDKWVRTEFGWKRLDDIRNSLSSQIIHQLHNISQRAYCSSSLITKTSGRSSSKKLSRAASPSSPSNEDHDLHEKLRHSGSSNRMEPSCSYTVSREREKRLNHLHLLLSQRCVSARSSSKESNHYSTVTDAINKLNFEQALQDDNCFPFICKVAKYNLGHLSQKNSDSYDQVLILRNVVALLYDVHQRTLSGSLQICLFRITELAKDIAIKSKKHSGLVLTMIERAITSLEKIRRQQFTGFAVRNTDSKLKSFLKMKRQLQSSQNEDHIQGYPSFEMTTFPSDCYRQIIAYLTHPRDVLNFGLTNSVVQSVTEENWVWRDLTHYHYGEMITPKLMDNASSAQPCWKDVFVDKYKQHRGRLREVSTAVCLCKNCNFVFWKSYGHPCSAEASPADSTSESVQKKKEGEADEPSYENLSTGNFLQLFVF